MHARERELGAVFYEAAGWERPQWYEANAPLVEQYGVAGREAEWDARWWSPIINAEHLAMRERAACSTCRRSRLRRRRPGRARGVQRVAVRQMDVPVGRVVYTPVLTPSGGFKSDLTIMRLGDELFRVVTGGAHGMADLKWFGDHAGGDAQLVDLTTGWTTIGLWGPRARDILAAVTRDDVSHEGFPFGTCRTIEIGSQLVLASRISYVGDLGWELYVPIEQGARLWDVVGRPARRTADPAGIGVYGTTGRLEKGYRAYGAELDAEYDVVEAGMAGAGSRSRTSSARRRTSRSARPSRSRCSARSPSTTTPRAAAGSATCWAASRSSRGTARRSPTPRAAARTSRARAPGRRSASTCSAYLPPEHAVEGEELAVRVHERALPGDRRRRRRAPCSTPRTRIAGGAVPA